MEVGWGRTGASRSGIEEVAKEREFVLAPFAAMVLFIAVFAAMAAIVWIATR